MDSTLKTDYAPELYFKTSRSSGKGGQHVNKTSTKVELNFNVSSSGLLTDEQKQIILQKLSNKINKNGVLQVVVQSERSQIQNKKIAIGKFHELIKKCLTKEKKRVKTKLKKGIKEKRLKNKKEHSYKKILRKRNYDT